MHNYFEIVSFTNSLPNQVDKLISLLDPKGHIKHRLYKHHGIHVILEIFRKWENGLKICRDWVDQ